MKEVPLVLVGENAVTLVSEQIVKVMPSTIVFSHDNHIYIAEVIKSLKLLPCPFIPPHQEHPQYKTMRHNY